MFFLALPALATLLETVSTVTKPGSPGLLGVIAYGGLKMDGSHDHRGNKGADRTVAQKLGDRKRSRHE